MFRHSDKEHCSIRVIRLSDKKDIYCYFQLTFLHSPRNGSGMACMEYNIRLPTLEIRMPVKLVSGWNIELFYLECHDCPTESLVKLLS